MMIIGSSGASEIANVLRPFLSLGVHRTPKQRDRISYLLDGILNQRIERCDRHMESSQELIYSVDNGIARITINRPEARNALSPAVIAGMVGAMRSAAEDASVRVVVLGGAGDKAFCAGADLSNMFDSASDPASSEDGPGVIEGHEARGDIVKLFRGMWSMGKPTIAKVQGWALAGGFGLAMACDMVVASEKARFGAPEINVGLWPFIITVPLVRSMPPKVALELMLTGRVVEAGEAKEIGFVNRVVPHDELDSAVDELASTLASRSPTLMRLGRDSFYSVWGAKPDDAFPHLQTMLTLASMTEDAKEGISAFLEKRQPTWKGR